jgi:predicted house-cleaning noncanonical NTP pyrophosphatase (MazG superfamily)
MKNKLIIMLFLCTLFSVLVTSGCKELVPKEVKSCVVNIQTDSEYRMEYAKKLKTNENNILDAYTKDQLSQMLYSQAEYTLKLNRPILDYIRGTKPQTTNVLIESTNISK